MGAVGHGEEPADKGTEEGGSDGKLEGVSSGMEMEEIVDEVGVVGSGDGKVIVDVCEEFGDGFPAINIGKDGHLAARKEEGRRRCGE